MLHIALLAPEIPPNTGNIIRLCANTGAVLHLIKPIAFQLEDKRLRRAGLDYQDLAAIHIHDNFTIFLDAIEGRRLLAFSAHGNTRYSDIHYSDNDCLLFGGESNGLPLEIRQHAAIAELLTIPMLPGNRSLNLSNSVAIACYEAWRQLDFSHSLSHRD
jgi:tRNA (cytidine/uridine-2'-O-)-methyltransferase